MVFVVACGPDEPEPATLRLDATVAFPPNDTVRLSLPASGSWCNDGHSLLLESLSPDGSGVLVRIRYRDSLASDSLPIVIPEDTTTVPAAIVALRFFLNDTPRGYSLDSGRVDLVRQGPHVRVTLGGTGIESAIRSRAHVESRDIPIGTDTVSCVYAR